MGKKKLAAAALTNTSYTVLARRYRPQQFADLVGQEPAAQALINALESNRVAHAYLFTGARGVGKTSTARILAKALNCVKGPTPTPCDQCESCHAIAAGEDVDVLEIDGASNNKVEEVRELRQNVQYRPSRSRYKIYIIDEVHMLSTSAFNALLKTLEEPPPHVKFIFATTEAQKIPVTILSRCQRFDFAGIGSKRIVERLQQILKDEEVEADAEALEIIARRASGSMRDAQSLLDQMLAFGGERLTVQQVHQLLGTADEGQIVELAAAILEQRPADALNLLAKAADESVQLGELLDQLLEYWRDLMVLNAAGNNVEGLSFPVRFHDTMRQQASGLTLDTILAGLDILSTTRTRLRGISHGRVLADMCLVRLCRLENLLPLAQIVRLLGQGTVATAPKVALPSSASSPVKKNSVAASPAAEAQIQQQTPLTNASRDLVWRQVLDSVGPMLGGFLEKASEVAISAPNLLVLRFPAKYNESMVCCQESSRSDRLEEALRKITGQAVKVRFEELAGDRAATAPAVRTPRSQQARHAVLQEPLVRRAVQEFGASLLRADEGFSAVSTEAPNANQEVDELPAEENADV